MEENTYKNLAKFENINWYQVSRCKNIEDLILKYIKKKTEDKISILDIGCGTGGTTNFLSKFGEIHGLEPSDIAIELFRKNYPEILLYKGGLNEINKIIKKEDYDLTTVLGVLYHENIKDPQKALIDINLKIKKAGWIIWHEAVYPSLTREMDRACSGARRFLPKDMLLMLDKAGFRPVFDTHITSFGFPIALLMARLEKLKNNKKTNHKSPDLRVPNKYLNWVLYKIARLEWKFAQYILPIPIGVSYFVLARKK